MLKIIITQSKIPYLQYCSNIHVMILYQPDCCNKRLPEFNGTTTKVYFPLMELSGQGGVLLHWVTQKPRRLHLVTWRTPRALESFTASFPSHEQQEKREQHKEDQKILWARTKSGWYHFLPHSIGRNSIICHPSHRGSWEM